MEFIRTDRDRDKRERERGRESVGHDHTHTSHALRTERKLGYAPNRPDEVSRVHVRKRITSAICLRTWGRASARATGAAAASRTSVRVGLRRGARLEPGEHVVDELGRRAAGGVLEHAEGGGLEEARPFEELGKR